MLFAVAFLHGLVPGHGPFNQGPNHICLLCNLFTHLAFVLVTAAVVVIPPDKGRRPVVFQWGGPRDTERRGIQGRAPPRLFS